MQTILITGATDGLGKATAYELAAKGYELILHGRNQQKGAELLKEIEAKTQNNKLYYYNADFAEIAQIKQLANDILANHSRLDVLINNAGLGIEPARAESKDGIELVFQVDYLSTYILSKMLMPLLEKSAPSRIVNVASAGQARMDFADPLLEKSWSGDRAYCQAKLAQITMSFATTDELKTKNITINALHPATYMPTKMVINIFTPLHKISDGVQSLVKLAIDESLANTTGKYFFMTRNEKASSQAYDLNAQKKLLELSKQLTGI